MACPLGPLADFKASTEDLISELCFSVMYGTTVLSAKSESYVMFCL